MIPALVKYDLNLFRKYLKNSKNYFEFGSGGSTYEAYKQSNIEKIFSVESSFVWIKTIVQKLNCNSYQINENDFFSKKLNFFFTEFNTKIGHLGIPLFNKKDEVKFLLGTKNEKINSINVEEDKIFTGIIIDIMRNSPFNNLIEYKDENDNLIKTWIHPKLIRTQNDKIITEFNKYSNSITKLNKSINIDLILIDGRFRVMCALKSLQVINDNCVVLIDDFFNRNAYHILLDYYDIIEKGTRMVALKKKKNIIISEDIFKQYENDLR